MKRPICAENLEEIENILGYEYGTYYFLTIQADINSLRQMYHEYVAEKQLLNRSAI